MDLLKPTQGSNAMMLENVAVDNKHKAKVCVHCRPLYSSRVLKRACGGAVEREGLAITTSDRIQLLPSPGVHFRVTRLPR
ncbi:hypothetical protein EVAR_80530_1 [Eumeta japonica]|uniref:Uncharacterized protein n=1 Tax=Eumeta variegata TaxID=151549 RepID=A0A4C1TLG9_EUMVA|nr:hypothetical protein EVAR_80530_1 [Eumeta japonica]